MKEIEKIGLFIIKKLRRPVWRHYIFGVFDATSPSDDGRWFPTQAAAHKYIKQVRED